MHAMPDHHDESEDSRRRYNNIPAKRVTIRSAP